jgi:hypothetical protein
MGTRYTGKCHVVAGTLNESKHGEAPTDLAAVEMKIYLLSGPTADISADKWTHSVFVSFSNQKRLSPGEKKMRLHSKVLH